jgi:ferredoxin
LRPEDFSQMLVDIHTLVKPQLTIMDGVTAMEGEGPGSGAIRNLGLILASRDAAALDAVAGAVIGLKPEDVLTTRDAGERGIGICDLSRIDVVGEKLEALVVPDFKLPATAYLRVMNSTPRGIAKYFLDQVSPRPKVKKKNCTACAKCVKACPTGAARMVGKVSVIEAKLCIRCMCCHEVCRYDAIYQGRPVLGAAVGGIIQAVRRA